MSSYRQALKAARAEHIRKLIDNNQNIRRFLFSTVARLTNIQTSLDLNIPSQFNSNRGSRGLMLESQTCNPKIVGSNLRTGRD